MKRFIILLLLTALATLFIAGCNSNPEQVRNQLYNNCTAAVRNFLTYDLPGNDWPPSCLRDIAGGFCGGLDKCLLWLHKTLPGVCENMGYGFLKYGEDNPCNTCPGTPPIDARDIALQALCEEVKKIYSRPVP